MISISSPTAKKIEGFKIPLFILYSGNKAISDMEQKSHFAQQMAGDML